jgi:mannan endo-1,4-beta-mannosidase
VNRPTLQEGSSGEAVKELQRALQRAGFDPGPIDGEFGPVTAAAVRSFQAARGLVVDGIVGPQTWGALFETFYVHNGHLNDSSGERVVLRGVNKMAVWDQDPSGRNWFPQIRKTNANVVRIVWLMDTSGEPAATVSNMDKVIQNCRDNNMIPMIELHDATMASGDPDTRGGWTKLGDIENFWTRADVTSVLKKHQRYLLLNIANEPGDESITGDEFKDQYKETIGAIRDAGINVPLVIDATMYGQKFDSIKNNASYLIDRDPQQNLIFSLHVWWHYGHQDVAGDFKQAITDVVAKRIPFIVGEFAGVCQECGNHNNDAPYETILEECHKNAIGWIAWEWGPGNEAGGCAEMNMTANGTYATIRRGWPNEVAITHRYSIKNTAKSTRARSL